MKREIPAYIERAILALSDPKRSEELCVALAKHIPHSTWYVGVSLQNACESLERNNQ